MVGVDVDVDTERPTFRPEPVKPLEISMLIDDGLTVTDITGPYEVLRMIPGATVKFVSESPGPKRADSGMLTLIADFGLEEVPHPDLIVVPAADFRRSLAGDRLLPWLRAASASARWTTSVCGGALLLGAAGLLRGRRATSHWGAMAELEATGAIPCPGARWVVDGPIVTAAGVSAGIDMALWLAGELAGETAARAIQLLIEYDPHPPYDSGAPANATPEVLAWAGWRTEQTLAELGVMSMGDFIPMSASELPAPAR